MKYHLVRRSVLRVHLHDRSQARDAEVLEVVVIRGDEPSDLRRRHLQQRRVRVDLRDALHALVHYRVADVHAGVAPFHDVGEDVVPKD